MPGVSSLLASLKAALLGGISDLIFFTKVGTGANNAVRATCVQSNGEILLGGFFTNFSNVTANRIVRLHGNGEPDVGFMINAGSAANNQVLSIDVQSDEKILLGGFFTTFNGVTVNRIVRLNSNGTGDTAFTTNTGTGANNQVDFITIQPDGKILIAGVFTAFNGVSVKCILRLNSDGTRDTGFVGTEVPSFSPYNSINSIALQPDGKICYSVSNRFLVGGDMPYFAFKYAVFRMTSTGAQDDTFNSNTGTNANNQTTCIAIQPDGKILIGGFFTAFNGTTANRIIRLNSNGTIDTAFVTNIGSAASAQVDKIVLQSDGKIILGGDFTTFNGVTVNRIVRLNSNGTRDTTFTTNTGTGANSFISTISSQPNRDIILGGSFTAFNGVTVNRVARIGGGIA